MAVKRGREYHVCGEEYNIKKSERGSNIILYLIHLIYNINTVGGGNFGEENQDLKNMGSGGEYKTLHTPDDWSPI